MTTIDYDPEACGKLSPEYDASEIGCRIMVQAYVVDDYEQVLGTSAGEFKWFCVDTDSDGECG